MYSFPVNERAGRSSLGKEKKSVHEYFLQVKCYRGRKIIFSNYETFAC